MERQTNILHIPNELLDIIFSDMDALSRIYIRSTCRSFKHIVSSIKKENSFSLYDTINYNLKSLKEFVDHVYQKVIESENNSTSYHLTRQKDTIIIFIRDRNRNRYKYSVVFEDKGVKKLKIYYDGRKKIFRIQKLEQDYISLPTLLFVLGMRFMTKIYKYNPIDYNFDENLIPMIARKMVGYNYKGELISEIIEQNFFV